MVTGSRAIRTSEVIPKHVFWMPEVVVIVSTETDPRR